MINNTTLKVPKKYHHMIDEVYREEDSYWVHLNEEYQLDGVRILHERTQKEILEAIRDVEKISQKNYSVEESKMINRLKYNMVEELNLALEKENTCLRYIKCSDSEVCESYRITVVDKFISKLENDYSIPNITKEFEIFVRDFFKTNFNVENTGFSNSVVTITVWNI